MLLQARHPSLHGEGALTATKRLCKGQTATKHKQMPATRIMVFAPTPTLLCSEQTRPPCPARSCWLHLSPINPLLFDFVSAPIGCIPPEYHVPQKNPEYHIQQDFYDGPSLYPSNTKYTRAPQVTSLQEEIRHLRKQLEETGNARELSAKNMEAQRDAAAAREVELRDDLQEARLATDRIAYSRDDDVIAIEKDMRDRHQQEISEWQNRAFEAEKTVRGEIPSLFRSLKVPSRRM